MHFNQNINCATVNYQKISKSCNEQKKNATREFRQINYFRRYIIIYYEFNRLSAIYNQRVVCLHSQARLSFRFIATYWIRIFITVSLLLLLFRFSSSFVCGFTLVHTMSFDFDEPETHHGLGYSAASGQIGPIPLLLPPSWLTPRPDRTRDIYPGS